METEQTKDWAVKQVTDKLLHQAETLQAEEAAKALDHPTIKACAVVVSMVGFDHYELSKDTRIAMDARKAHMFVAVNCEEACRRMLRLMAVPDEEVASHLRAIVGEAVRLREKRRLRASLQKGPKDTVPS